MPKWISGKTVQSVATEVVSIVVAVLLALAVNEWNEDRVKKIRSNEAIQNIIQEFKGNLTFLNHIHKNNAKIVEVLNNKDESVSHFEGNFVPGLQIQDTAWNTLNSTGVAEYIDYKVLFSMSKIYSLQEIYRSLGYQLVQSMMSNKALSYAVNPTENIEPKNELYADNMALLVTLEASLISEIEKSLATLEGQNSKE